MGRSGLCPEPNRDRARRTAAKKTYMEAAQILDRVVAKFIGTKHERDIKRMQPLGAGINAPEGEVQALSDGQLGGRFAALEKQVPGGLKRNDPAETPEKDA